MRVELFWPHGLQKAEKQFLVSMNDSRILNAVRLPARLNSEQVAALLNCHKDYIQILIRKNLLTPLGRPSHNATRYFATQSIERLLQDEVFLEQATNAMYRAVKAKNKMSAKKLGHLEQDEAA